MRVLASIVVAAALSACGAPADEVVGVAVSFPSSDAADEAVEVTVRVYELGEEDGANPCTELMAGGDAEAIGLENEESETVVVRDRPIAVVFALHLSVGSKAFYAEARNAADEPYVRACKTLSPTSGDQIDLALR